MRLGLSCSALKASGGMERYAMDVVAGLARLGHRPTVFARAFDRSLPDYGRIDPVEISLALVPGKLRDEVFARRLVIARRAHPVDVMIGTNRTRSADIAICGGTHLGHGIASGRPQGFWDRRQVRLEKDFYAGSSIVVAHSRLMADELRDLYALPDEKLRTLHPPVDAGRFRPVDAATRRALRHDFGFDEETIVFAFPSSSHRRKGLDVLRAVFETTDLPVLLAVAGRPIGKAGRNLREMGYVAGMERLYAAADFAILASDYEPFGLVGVEAVLCGTPVVTAETLGCREVIAETARIDFTRADPASLAEALARAVARVRAGTARLADGRAALLYDPDVDTHVRALVAFAESIASEARP